MGHEPTTSTLRRQIRRTSAYHGGASRLVRALSKQSRTAANDCVRGILAGWTRDRTRPRASATLRTHLAAERDTHSGPSPHLSIGTEGDAHSPPSPHTGHPVV